MRAFRHCLAMHICTCIQTACIAQNRWYSFEFREFDSKMFLSVLFEMHQQKSLNARTFDTSALVISCLSFVGYKWQSYCLTASRLRSRCEKLIFTRYILLILLHFLYSSLSLSHTHPVLADWPLLNNILIYKIFDWLFLLISFLPMVFSSLNSLAAMWSLCSAFGLVGCLRYIDGRQE